MVIWIIGKSGSGKTYLAKQLYKSFKSLLKSKIIWIDGDNFRKKFSHDLGYSIQDRKENSRRIQRFCLKYEKKNFLVLCSILSIFKSHQKENRKIFNDYFQIYIKADQLLLKKRNNKKIYNIKKNVVGKDINFPKPVNSDLVIKNNFNKKYLKNMPKILNLIYEKL